MNFKESPYYNEKLLGTHLYRKIQNIHEILSVNEYFNINDTQNEYHIKDIDKDYRLKVQDYYYELDCQDYRNYLYLIFDKPVHITGKYCRNVIAPEIVIKSNRNSYLLCCTANKVIINSENKDTYEISSSKINDVYFHNSKIRFWSSEVKNFYIYNKYLVFDTTSWFLEYYKIKCFGSCKELKEKLLNSKKYKQGIIHIE